MVELPAQETNGVVAGVAARIRRDMVGRFATCIPAVMTRFTTADGLIVIDTRGGPRRRAVTGVALPGGARMAVRFSRSVAAVVALAAGAGGLIVIHTGRGPGCCKMALAAKCRSG